jgi:hypothetical protein
VRVLVHDSAVGARRTRVRAAQVIW